MKANQKFIHLWISIAFFCASLTFLASCSDDVKESIIAEVELPSDTDLKYLEQWSYTIPFEIKSDSEWKIEFAFKNGNQICYAYPNEGKGNATVNICILDNWTDERCEGDMYIQFPKDETKNQTITLRQKCNLDADTNNDSGAVGDIRYAVGYGYNILGQYASANSVARNQIIEVALCREDKKIQSSSITAKFNTKVYTGTTIMEWLNELNADAKLNGKYLGFKGEIGATFGTRDYTKSDIEYSSIYSTCVLNEVSLRVNLDEIVGNYITEAARNAINGLDYDGGRWGKVTTQYPTTNEGFAQLVKDYGTHVIVSAKLGGRLSKQMMVDVSKVEGYYDLTAYANCTYENKFINTKDNVKDSLRVSYDKNNEALEFSLTVEGGGSNEVTALGMGKDNKISEEAIENWMKSLGEEKNRALVEFNDINKDLIPIYELVDRNLPNGEERYNALKTYIDQTIYEQDNMYYETGSVIRIPDIPTFKENKTQGTLIKDVYLGNQHVAKICNEFIPVIDKFERVTVIYPVLNNKTKFNLGYFVGDAVHRPAKICWSGSNLTITEYKNESIGQKKEILLRGSKFMTSSNDVIQESRMEDSYLDANKFDNFNTISHKYPLVKIFNNIWTREDYETEIKGDGNKIDPNNREYIDTKLYLRPQVAEDPNFPPSGWKVAASSDYTVIQSILTSNEIEKTAVAFIENGVLGYDAEFKGWVDWGFSPPLRATDGKQTEYLTSDKHHVRIRKDGSFAVEEGVHYKNWYMSVRLIKK